MYDLFYDINIKGVIENHTNVYHLNVSCKWYRPTFIMIVTPPPPPHPSFSNLHHKPIIHINLSKLFENQQKVESTINYL